MRKKNFARKTMFLSLTAIIAVVCFFVFISKAISDDMAFCIIMLLATAACFTSWAAFSRDEYDYTLVWNEDEDGNIIEDYDDEMLDQDILDDDLF